MKNGEKKYKYSTKPIEVGDWNYQQMYKSVDLNQYQVEDKTEDGKFVVVQTEGTYQHRMTVDKKKLKRL